MNKQSISAYNKILVQMDKLSYLIHRQKNFRQELKSILLKNQPSSDSSTSDLENIDAYFQQFDNPTTKSLPIDQQPNFSSNIHQENSESFNTIYRNPKQNQSQEEDLQNILDDKSTVILAGIICPPKKKKGQQVPILMGQYSSLNDRELHHKRQVILSKANKVTSKSNINSMPSECHNEQSEVQINFKKSSSISKQVQRIESPAVYSKMKKIVADAEYQSVRVTRDLKVKLQKISKIDREELNRLQQKKFTKRAEPSSNRKKVKITLGSAKSTTNMNYSSKTHKPSQVNLAKPHSIKSVSKVYESLKKEAPRKGEQKQTINHQEEYKSEKHNKKLNRVNICKLQQNIKRTHEKKSTKECSMVKAENKQKKSQKKVQRHMI